MRWMSLLRRRRRRLRLCVKMSFCLHGGAGELGAEKGAHLAAVVALCGSMGAFGCPDASCCAAPVLSLGNWLFLWPWCAAPGRGGLAGLNSGGLACAGCRCWVVAVVVSVCA